MCVRRSCAAGEALAPSLSLACFHDCNYLDIFNGKTEHDGPVVATEMELRRLNYKKSRCNSPYISCTRRSETSRVIFRPDVSVKTSRIILYDHRSKGPPSCPSIICSKDMTSKKCCVCDLQSRISASSFHILPPDINSGQEWTDEIISPL